MTTTSSFKIGLVQRAFSASTEENLAAGLESFRKAASDGAQIVCLSELCTSRYFCNRETIENFALAEELSGRTVSAFQEAAAKSKAAVIVPFFEKRAPGVFHNSAAVIDADGELLGVYRKMHIPDDPLFYEKFYFTPGDTDSEFSGFQVFKTKFATIGVLICWDQWYPEAARITALLGAEVIFYPTAIGWLPHEKDTFGPSQADAWRTVQRGHAIANGVYIAAANRIGVEPIPESSDPGLEFFGRSFVSDPFGRVTAEASGSEQILIAECERKLIEETRQNWPFLRDRRIDAYPPILKRYLGAK